MIFYQIKEKHIVLVSRPAQIGEKVAFVQVVARLKDNGRKEHQEKGSRRKFLHVLDLKKQNSLIRYTQTWAIPLFLPQYQYPIFPKRP